MALSQYCVTPAQQVIKNAEGHLKMIVVAHSGMFRGVTNHLITSSVWPLNFPQVMNINN